MLPLVTHPSYSYGFPPNHRFAMEKFALLAEQLRATGLLRSDNLFRPSRAKLSWLERVHCPDYIERFIDNRWSAREIKRCNLPWSEGLVERSLISPAGTVLTAQLALNTGIACHLAGGTHHAHYNYASGFCVFNDLAITAKLLLEENGLDRVLIFDCDVHQGDGTAMLLADEPRAISCSIHAGNNFPFTKSLSDVDVALDDGVGDEAYLQVVEQTLERLLEQHKPQLVLYDAGVDIYAGDPLGRLQVSEVGIRRRDRAVLSMLYSRKIPVATVIGGGYDDDRQALARRHAIVVEEAARLVGWPNQRVGNMT